MTQIRFEIFKGRNVDFLKPLMNSLMDFQVLNAVVRPEVMRNYSYDNSLKEVYRGSDDEFIYVAYDEERPVGFAYATTEIVREGHINYVPDWAKGLRGIGYYPLDYETPKRVGTFKMLYVDKEYRNLHIGKDLSNKTIFWLKSQVADDLWVYITNGNEDVEEFFEEYGFKFQHSVYNGLINAFKMEL